MTASIVKHFSTLKDSRIERCKQHNLVDIIVLTLSAVVSGADGWEAIEDFGKEKTDWLRQYIALENGIPSHDCIACVLSKLSASGFRECFMSWTQSVLTATSGEFTLMILSQLVNYFVFSSRACEYLHWFGCHRRRLAKL